MHKLFTIGLLFLFSQATQLYAQQNCNCELLIHKKQQITEAIEGQNDLLVAQLLTVDALKTAGCRQEFYYWKSYYFNKTNNIDSFRKYLSLLHNELQSQSCEENATKYHYLQGYYYIKLDLYDSASNCFLKAIEMGKKIAHTEILAKSNIGLGLVFDRIMQPQKSIPYYKEGIRLAERMEDDRIRLAGLVNLQSSFGMCYDENEQANYLDSVKYYCFKTLVLAKELHSKKEIIRTFVTLAGAYLSEKKYAQSLAYCDSVIAMADQKHNKSQLHSAYFKMAQCYIDMKAFQKSIDAANLSLQFADNNAKKANAIYRLFEANKLLGHFEKALYYHEQLKALDEEVLNNDRLKAVTELEQKYEKSKNEQTIKDLNQSSEIKSLRIKVLLFGIVLSILLILIIFFVFRQKAFKSKEIILEIEQRLNRSRMNPHFFFNAMTTLQGLAFKENDGKKMAEYLYKFSSLMRKTLESTFADYVTIEDELNFIDHYIELQLLKQKDTFEFHVDIAPDVDQSEVLIPSMIIQPFLENAIEHGFAAIDYKGLLHLSIRTSESELHVIISDNGKGIVETNNIQNKHISRAIQITKDRLYLISKGNKKKSSYFIKNREPHGVEIELVLPLLYEHPSISN